MHHRASFLEHIWIDRSISRVRWTEVMHVCFWTFEAKFEIESELHRRVVLSPQISFSLVNFIVGRVASRNLYKSLARSSLSQHSSERFRYLISSSCDSTRFEREVCCLFESKRNKLTRFWMNTWEIVVCDVRIKRFSFFFRSLFAINSWLTWRSDKYKLWKWFIRERLLRVWDF